MYVPFRFESTVLDGLLAWEIRTPVFMISPFSSSIVPLTINLFCAHSTDVVNNKITVKIFKDRVYSLGAIQVHFHKSVTNKSHSDLYDPIMGII